MGGTKGRIFALGDNAEARWRSAPFNSLIQLSLLQHIVALENQKLASHIQSIPLVSIPLLLALTEII